MNDGIVSSIREQGKAIMVMMSVAILSVLAMIVLGYLSDIIAALPGLGLGNNTASINVTSRALITLFITAFGIVGSFASITVLIIVVKVIIGVVKGLKN